MCQNSIFLDLDPILLLCWIQGPTSVRSGRRKSPLAFLKNKLAAQGAPPQRTRHAPRALCRTPSAKFPGGAPAYWVYGLGFLLGAGRSEGIKVQSLELRIF